MVGQVEGTVLEDEGEQEELALLVGEKGLPAIEVTRCARSSGSAHDICLLCIRFCLPLHEAVLSP